MNFQRFRKELKCRKWEESVVLIVSLRCGSGVARETPNEKDDREKMGTSQWAFRSSERHNNGLILTVPKNTDLSYLGGYPSL
jgi:hypothetical protein